MLTRRAARQAVYRMVAASGLGAPTGPHLTRFAMYRRLRQVIGATGWPGGGRDTERARLLAVSGSAPLARAVGLGRARIVDADYPEFDLLDLAFPDRSFDAVVTDQVLEHVRGDPFRAMRESIRVLRPGGLVVHTTCFLNWIHPDPGDFWRFTPDALRLLCQGVAEPIEIGGWGNLSLFAVTRLGLRYAPVPEARWHPLYWAATRNNPRWPVTTWLVARRPPSPPDQPPARR